MWVNNEVLHSDDEGTMFKNMVSVLWWSLAQHRENMCTYRFLYVTVYKNNNKIIYTDFRLKFPKNDEATWKNKHQYNDTIMEATETYIKTDYSLCLSSGQVDLTTVYT